MSTSHDPGAGLAGRSQASRTEILDLYDTWAAGSYDRDLSAWGYDAPERAAEMAVAALDAGNDTGTARDRSGDTISDAAEVLDAGCGTGRVGDALHALGVRNIVGGDFSTVSVEAARARGVYAEVTHLDLNGPLGYDDDRFAATVSVGVFTYVTNIDSTLRELLRITRPGASVIFTQRTDLWDERDCATTIDGLTDDGLCTAVVSDPRPYLPGHPEFGDALGIRYITLVRALHGTSA